MSTPSLTSAQRQVLKTAAHPLHAVVQTGMRGLTDAVIAEADGALDHHELIKVRLVAERAEREEMAEQICERLGAVLVQQIGQVGIFYRENTKRARFRDQLKRA